MKTYTVQTIAKLAVDANRLRDKSYVQGTLWSPRYRLTWEQAVEAAFEASAIPPDNDLAQVIWFLAISGQGADTCAAILAQQI